MDDRTPESNSPLYCRTLNCTRRAVDSRNEITSNFISTTQKSLLSLRIFSLAIPTNITIIYCYTKRFSKVAMAGNNTLALWRIFKADMKPMTYIAGESRPRGWIAHCYWCDDLEIWYTIPSEWPRTRISAWAASLHSLQGRSSSFIEMEMVFIKNYNCCLRTESGLPLVLHLVRTSLNKKSICPEANAL